MSCWEWTPKQRRRNAGRLPRSQQQKVAAAFTIDPDTGDGKTLDVTIEEILGLERPRQKKRGPQSQLERQLAAIASLPRKELQQLLGVVQAFADQHAEQ